MQQRRFWSLCLACAAMAATGLMFGPLQAQESDAVLDLERTGPLWAYAHPAPAQPGDTHVPQTLVRDPSKRPNETMEEVTKVWTMPGSDLKLTRLDLRSLTSRRPTGFPATTRRCLTSWRMAGRRTGSVRARSAITRTVWA